MSGGGGGGIADAFLRWPERDPASPLSLPPASAAARAASAKSCFVNGSDAKSAVILPKFNSFTPPVRCRNWRCPLPPDPDAEATAPPLPAAAVCEVAERSTGVFLSFKSFPSFESLVFLPAAAVPVLCDLSCERSCMAEALVAI